MNRLDIYQAIWAMEDIPNREASYDIETKIEMIKDADFDGALNFIDNANDITLAESYRVSELIKSNGLKLGLSCQGHNLEDMKKKIDYTKQSGGEFLNIMVLDYYIYGEEALQLLKETVEYGKEEGVKVFIETHRGTVTQDLIRTVDYVEKLRDMLLTLDLSHYVVIGEIAITNDKIETHFDKLIERAGSIHVRISNGEQVQVPLNRISKEQYDQYIKWWETGIINGYRYLTSDEKFPVVIELGPEDYQQKIMIDGKWIYDVDRWEEAIRWKTIFREMKI